MLVILSLLYGKTMFSSLHCDLPHDSALPLSGKYPNDSISYYTGTSLSILITTILTKAQKMKAYMFIT